MLTSRLALVLAFLATSAPALANGVPPPSAIPEPGTLALMGMGAAALGVVGWLRGRK